MKITLRLNNIPRELEDKFNKLKKEKGLNKYLVPIILKHEGYKPEENDKTTYTECNKIKDLENEIRILLSRVEHLEKLYRDLREGVNVSNSKKEYNDNRESSKEFVEETWEEDAQEAFDLLNSI